MQGLFSAGSIPAALGILGSAYPPGQRKNKVFATFSAGNPSGWVIGLIIGGLLTSYSSWRWGFRVVAIMSGLITVLAFIYIPKDAPRDPARRGEKVDWLGALFVICGTGGICYALRYAFLDYLMIVMLEMHPMDGRLGILYSLSFLDSHLLEPSSFWNPKFNIL